MLSHFFRMIIIVCLVPFLGTTDSFALNQILVVNLTNGESVRISLTDNPKATFTDTNLVIETDLIKLSYSREEIANFKYENSSTGIGDVVRDNDVIIVLSDDNIIIANLKQDTTVKLISTDGVIVASVKPSIDGTANIMTSDFSPGIYIVNTGSINHKILIR